MLYTSPWSRFEPTTSVVIVTGCIGSCKIQLPYNHGHDGPVNDLRWEVAVSSVDITEILYNHWWNCVFLVSTFIHKSTCILILKTFIIVFFNVLHLRWKYILWQISNANNFFVTEKQIHVRCIFVGLDTIATSHPPFLFFQKPLGLLFESG